MHVHLVDFQVLNRQKLNVPGYLAAYEKWLAGGRRPTAKPVLADYLVGPPIPPDPDEALALKDTVKVYTGMVTRIIQTFNVAGGIPSIPGSGTTLPAEYLQHCHILEHEDHDKMRPWAVVANPAGGVDAGDGGSAGVNPALAAAGATMLATAAVGGAVLARRYLADEAPPSATQ
jgi:spore coat protein A